MGVVEPLYIVKFTPRFERWDEKLHGPKPTKTNASGDEVVSDWHGKPFLWVDGEPKFAELAIVRSFQRHGWDGVWVYSPSGRNYTNDWPLDQGRVESLPENAAEMMASYISKAGEAGCPDVFVWTEDDFLFVESKQKEEGYNANQKRWLKALVEAGVSREQLSRTVAVVRWTPKRAQPHEAERGHG